MAKTNRRAPRAGELPHQVQQRGALSSFARAAQGNFDHLMGIIRNLVKGHNSLVDDVEELSKALSGTIETTQTIEATLGAGLRHEQLSGVTADDHHPRTHDHSTAADGASLAPETLVVPKAAVPSQTAEGSVVWDTDDDRLTVGDGTSRKVLLDTRHETAADPHTGYVQKSTLTAKGDLYVASGPGVPARLGVGANGQVLTADSLQPLGVKWADAPVGGGPSLEDKFDAKGDLLVGQADNLGARLGVGADGQVLTADSSRPLGVKWADVPVGGGGGGTSSGLILVWSSRMVVIDGQRSPRIYIPRAATIDNVYVSLPVPNAGTTIIDIYKNGTTIFTTQSNRPTIVNGILSGHMVPDITTLAVDDYLECIVVESGGARGRLQVYIVCT